MNPLSPPSQPRKGAGEPQTRLRGDSVSRLFTTGNRPTGGDAALAASQRSERAARIAGDVKRGLFFALILVAVAFVLVQFVAAL